MGWAGGSEIATNLWKLVRRDVPVKKRKKVARKFIEEFENNDCDTMGECEQLVKDAGIDWNDDGDKIDSKTGEPI